MQLRMESTAMKRSAGGKGLQQRLWQTGCVWLQAVMPDAGMLETLSSDAVARLLRWSGDMAARGRLRQRRAWRTACTHAHAGDAAALQHAHLERLRELLAAADAAAS